MRRTLRVLMAVAVGITMLLNAGGLAWSAPTASPAKTAPAKRSPVIARTAPLFLPGLRPLTIQTVPPVVGVRFAIDNHVMMTGADGAARTSISKAQRGELALARDAHLKVVSPSVDVRTGVRAQFAGWYDGGYHFDKKNPSGQLLLAAFDFYYLTTFHFIDGGGAPVRSALHDLQLHATSGATVTVADPSQPIWLRGLRVASSAGHLAVDDLSYTVASVTAKGNDVVRGGEQRLRPSRNAQVTIRSQFFTVQFKAHDAFLGRATGSTLELFFADGSSERFPLHNGEVTIPQLPRGNYQLKLATFGLVEHRGVTVSRNQTVSVPVLNALDLGIVALVVLAIAIALVILARARRRGHVTEASPPVIDVDTRTLEPSRS